MSLKVYIAYGTASDQVTALRLQALGAVNGLSVYVPPAFTRQSADGDLEPNSQQQLDNCDVVLGIVTDHLSAACRRELEVSNQRDKQTIVLQALGHSHDAMRLSQFSRNVVSFDPDDPTKAEQEIVQFLRESGLRQDTAKELLALGTVALGLMIFVAQD